MPKVTIYGARTLIRYTEGILQTGFTNNKWEVVEPSIDLPNAIVYQIHGAPEAQTEDETIKEIIRRDGTKKDGASRIILVHRPDEVQIRLPGLSEILRNNIETNIGLVFLGDKHLNDAFFQARNVIRKIIPHGFFSVDEQISLNPIVVGSHTTWGEMRSVEHAVKILGEVFRLDSGINIQGYLGGKPEKELQKNNLQTLWNRFNSDIPICFFDAHDMAAFPQHKKQHVIFVDVLNSKPSEIKLTYNIQLYYLNNKVRTGESSGSAHTNISIPVIFEMNGAEVIEDLRVIRVPYGPAGELASVDFKKGAALIFESAANGNYQDMLKHNLEQAKKFNNTYIARDYIKFFAELQSM